MVKKWYFRVNARHFSSFGRTKDLVLLQPGLFWPSGCFREFFWPSEGLWPSSGQKLQQKKFFLFFLMTHMSMHFSQKYTILSKELSEFDIQAALEHLFQIGESTTGPIKLHQKSNMTPVCVLQVPHQTGAAVKKLSNARLIASAVLNRKIFTSTPHWRRVQGTLQQEKPSPHLKLNLTTPPFSTYTYTSTTVEYE